MRVFLARQAFATDSGDESPWIYYRWLLGNSLAHLRQAQQQAQQEAGGPGSGEADVRLEDARAVLGEVRQAAVLVPSSVAACWTGRAYCLQARVCLWTMPVRALAAAVCAQVLAREVARFGEALAQDPDARWPLLMTARLKQAQLSLGVKPEETGADDLQAEVQAAYHRLAHIDPMRAGYYADAAAGKAFVVVQALGTL